MVAGRISVVFFAVITSTVISVLFLQATAWAANPTFLSQFEVDKSFAVSDSSTQSKWFAIGSYPKWASSWPSKSTTEVGMWPVSCGAEKLFPYTVGTKGDGTWPMNSWFAFDGSGNIIYQNWASDLYYQGNFRNYPADCGSTRRSFATQQKAPWVNFRPDYTPSQIQFMNPNPELYLDASSKRTIIKEAHGTLVNPMAYSEWAIKGSDYNLLMNGFRSAYVTPYPTVCAIARAGSSRPQFANVVSKVLTARIIWGNPCNTMGTSYNNARANGTTLFRKVINFTQEEIDQIREAEQYQAPVTIQNNFGKNTDVVARGGLYLSAVADDFWSGWMNGVYTNSSEVTVATDNYFRIPLDVDNGDGTYGPYKIKVGQNVLAFEVNDKMMFDIPPENYDSAGVGLKYALNLMVPLPGATYKLAPETSCTSLTYDSSVATNITCTYTVPMKGTEPDIPPKKVSLPTDIATVCKTAGSELATDAAGIAGCVGNYDDVMITGSISYTRTFTIPSGYTGNVCTAVSANPSERVWNAWHTALVTNNTPVWSNFVCITPVGGGVDASAYTNFFGGDVNSLGRVKFSAPFSKSGSRAQYAILARGLITNPVSANDYDFPNKLVFANIPSLGYLGVTYPAKEILLVGAPSYSTALGAINITLPPTPATYGTNFQSYAPSPGPLEINGVTDVDSQITVRVDGDVRILGNITLDSVTGHTLSSIPNVTIIASGDITIDSSVTRIEATLQAGGSLKTCSNEPASEADCDKKLVIYGPTLASEYYLYRTSTNTDFNEASETFYFPPSAIMAPYARGSGSLVPTTEYEIELPPRY